MKRKKLESNETPAGAAVTAAQELAIGALALGKGRKEAAAAAV